MKKVPANRVAALGAAAAAIAAGVVSVITAVDSWPRAVVLVAALAVVGAVAVVFLRGAQKDEARKAKLPLLGSSSAQVETAQAMERAYNQRLEAKNAALLKAKPDPLLDPEKGHGEDVARELGLMDAKPSDPSKIPADRGDHEAADKDKPDA